MSTTRADLEAALSTTRADLQAALITALTCEKRGPGKKTLGDIAGQFGIHLRTLNKYLGALRKLLRKVTTNVDVFCRAAQGEDHTILQHMIDVATVTYGKRGFGANEARMRTAQPAQKQKGKDKYAKAKAQKEAELQDIPTFTHDGTLSRDKLLQTLMLTSGSVKVAMDPQTFGAHMQLQQAPLEKAFGLRKLESIDHDPDRQTRLANVDEHALFPAALDEIAAILETQVHGRALIFSKPDGAVQETHIDRYDISQRQYEQVISGDRMSPVSALWSPTGGHVYLFPGTQYLIGEAGQRTSRGKAIRLHTLARGEGVVRVEFAPNEILLFNSMLWHHGGSYPDEHRRLFAYLMGGNKCIRLTNQIDVVEGTRRKRVAAILRLKDVIAGLTF